MLDQELLFPEKQKGIQQEKRTKKPSHTNPIVVQYEKEMEKTPQKELHQAWERTQGVYAAFELSVGLITSLHKSTPKHIPFILNSSTGKDSTVTTQVVIQCVTNQLQTGEKWERPIVVAIADTASEFPEMRTRMYAEAAAINSLGEKNKLPITARIVTPPVQKRLLVELCGNGKPLPALSQSGKAQGVSSWCMDRVKAGTLQEINRQMADKYGDFIQILGVRDAESTRRKITIEKYSKELPLGLSNIDTGKRKNGEPLQKLAAIPIVHWANSDVSGFLRNFSPIWRPEGREEIRAIYLKGSPLEGDPNYSPSECSVTISDEGKVSNSCSDLSGTRYGCWHCFLSSNKSLKNTARRDPKYKWLKAFHTYTHSKAKKAIQRADFLKKKGFTKTNSFTKTFTFQERYKMLMLLYRAQMESGFSLLLPEEEAQIQKFWEKHGIFSVTPADAKKDALTWKKTGKWKTFFEGIVDETHRLCNSLSEGIPFGATIGLENLEELQELDNFDQTKKKRVKPLELIHLLSMSGQGFGTPPYPKILAYIFEDQSSKGSIISMITDTPSLLGLPTQTGLLNGMCAASWKCLGIREPLPWEREVAQDRNFAYQVDTNLDPNKSNLKSCPQYQKLEWFYQLNMMKTGTLHCEDPLKDHWFDCQLIGQTEPISKTVLESIFILTEELAVLSAELTSHFSKARKNCLQLIEPYSSLIQEETPPGLEARREIRKIVRNTLKIQEVLPTLQEYSRLIKMAAKAITNNLLNTSIILKFIYLHELLAVDPEEGKIEIRNTLKLMNLSPKTLQFTQTI